MDYNNENKNWTLFRNVLQVTIELVASAQALAVQTTSRKISFEKYAVIFKLNYEKL